MDSPDRPEEEQIAPLLRTVGQTLVTAESCTGGLIGSLVTDVSGSSDYYRGGVVAYDNQIKQNVLGVRAETLAAAGAVSAAVALQMAHGARRLLEADYALAVTGIAGPTGGTATKPVGRVYIALVGPGIEWVEERTWTGDRRQNKMWSARRALQMLIDHLQA